MKRSFILLFFIFIGFSCATKNELSKEFNCDSDSFSNLEKIEDVKKLFSIHFPDSWKTNLYYDNNQSSIFSADTTKQLTETMLIDITHISNQLLFDTSFTEKFKSSLLQEKLVEITSGLLIFKEKNTYYSIAIGKKRTFEYKIYNLFIKLDENNYIHSKIEVYGDSLVDQRICTGINLLEKITY
tara:strand:+ start:466 stop:1017 length:552 start_codon:yes stop_codon:yes gene_type:complete